MTEAIPKPRSSVENTLPLAVVDKSVSDSSKMATYRMVQKVLGGSDEKELAVYRDIQYCIEWLAEDYARIDKAVNTHCVDTDARNCAHPSHYWHPVAFPCLTREIAEEALKLHKSRKKLEDQLATQNTEAAAVYKAKHSRKRK